MDPSSRFARRFLIAFVLLEAIAIGWYVVSTLHRSRP
jgi:hypothetical protein